MLLPPEVVVGELEIEELEVVGVPVEGLVGVPVEGLVRVLVEQ